MGFGKDNLRSIGGKTMLVKEVMTKNVVTIEKNKSVLDACLLYRDLKIGSIIITNDNVVEGIITERDIIERAICEKKDPSNTSVKSIMTKKIINIHPLETVEKALEKMKEYNIKKLPVINKDEIVGILTVTDISKARPDLSKRFMNSWVKSDWED